MPTDDDQNLPPLAQRATPVVILPPALPAVPALPAPAAAFSHAALPQRPGILSAIGVLSILVACLGGLTNLVGWGQSALAYRVAATVRTMRSSPSMAAPATQPGGGGSPLTAAEISGAIQRAQSEAGNALTPAHVAGITAALQDPHQQLVPPGTAWSPIRAAMVNADGSAFVYFSGGLLMLDAQGQVTNTSIESNELAKFQIPVWVCVAAEGDAVANLLLFVFLFIAAIVLMRNGRWGRRMHLGYAFVKIPLSIAGGLATAAATSDFWLSVTGELTSTDPSSAHRIFVETASGICGVGLIYPIVLLIAMYNRRVRNFYKMVGG